MKMIDGAFERGDATLLSAHKADEFEKYLRRKFAKNMVVVLKPSQL